MQKSLFYKYFRRVWLKTFVYGKSVSGNNFTDRIKETQRLKMNFESGSFNVGGIPEEIDHKVNGNVARYKDAADLAEGIRYVLAEENHERLSQECVAKVARCYSEKSVVEQ